jgi:hypothetical protein
MPVIARLRRFAFPSARTWLDTLPKAPPLSATAHVRWCILCPLRRRHGESRLSPGAPDALCCCGTRLCAIDAEHALTRRSLMRCVCCTIMKASSLCARRCAGGGACHPPRSKGSPTTSSNSTFTCRQFITGMLQELSVCLFQCIGSINIGWVDSFVHASGGSLLPGLTQLMATLGRSARAWKKKQIDSEYTL